MNGLKPMRGFLVKLLSYVEKINGKTKLFQDLQKNIQPKYTTQHIKNFAEILKKSTPENNRTKKAFLSPCAEYSISFFCRPKAKGG